MLKRKLGMVDLETGHVYTEGIAVLIPSKVKIKEKWVMAFQQSLETLARNPSMTVVTYRVLMFMLSRADFENKIPLISSEIARELGLTKPQVSKAVNLLVKNEVIVEDRKIGSAKIFRFSRDFIWKGKVRNLEKERAKGNLPPIKLEEARDANQN